MFTYLCRGRFNTNGSQTQLEHHMTRCIEHNFFNIPNMKTNKEMKIID